MLLSSRSMRTDAGTWGPSDEGMADTIGVGKPSPDT
jgi:hypothetical protein